MRMYMRNHTRVYLCMLGTQPLPLLLASFQRRRPRHGHDGTASCSLHHSWQVLHWTGAPGGSLRVASHRSMWASIREIDACNSWHFSKSHPGRPQWKAWTRSCTELPRPVPGFWGSQVRVWSQPGYGSTSRRGRGLRLKSEVQPLRPYLSHPLPRERWIELSQAKRSSSIVVETALDGKKAGQNGEALGEATDWIAP